MIYTEKLLKFNMKIFNPTEIEICIYHSIAIQLPLAVPSGRPPCNDDVYCKAMLYFSRWQSSPKAVNREWKCHLIMMTNNFILERWHCMQCHSRKCSAVTLHLIWCLSWRAITLSITLISVCLIWLQGNSFVQNNPMFTDLSASFRKLYQEVFENPQGKRWVPCVCVAYYI